MLSEFPLFRFLETIHNSPYLIAIPVSLIVIIVIIVKAVREQGEKDKQHIRGARLGTESDLRKRTKRLTSENSIPVTDTVRIPRQNETTHFFIIGKPGSGKSQLLYRTIGHCLGRYRKSIIYDFKGDLVAKFYDPKKHILLNPFDQRARQWSLFTEIRPECQSLDINTIASSLIPYPAPPKDSYWANSARTILAAVITYCIHNNERTHRAIHKYCTRMPAELMEILRTCPGCETAANLLSEPKMAASIKGEMSTHTEALSYFPEMEPSGFSLRKWISDPLDRRSIFLSNTSQIQDSIRPILSLIIDFTGKCILDLPDDRDRRIMFFIDEFATLQPLPSVVRLLAQGRSKGVSCWIAVQNMGQLEALYGQESNTIVGSCSSSFIFSVDDPKTTKYLSDKIGDREVRQIAETKGSTNQTGGRGSKTSSASYSYHTEKLVLPSEIQQLPSLTAFFKLSDYPICKIPIKIMPLPDKSSGFELRPTS